MTLGNENQHSGTSNREKADEIREHISKVSNLFVDFDNMAGRLDMVSVQLNDFAEGDVSAELALRRIADVMWHFEAAAKLADIDES